MRRGLAAVASSRRRPTTGSGAEPQQGSRGQSPRWGVRGAKPLERFFGIRSRILLKNTLNKIDKTAVVAWKKVLESRSEHCNNIKISLIEKLGDY